MYLFIYLFIYNVFVLILFIHLFIYFMFRSHKTTINKKLNISVSPAVTIDVP